jgi:hypothetical protein
MACYTRYVISQSQETQNDENKIFNHKHDVFVQVQSTSVASPVCESAKKTSISVAGVAWRACASVR